MSNDMAHLSFLCPFRPSPQKPSAVEKDKKSAQVETGKDSQEGKPDARDRDQFYSRVETYSISLLSLIFLTIYLKLFYDTLTLD